MPRDLPQPPDAIRVRGARQNNLKNLNIDIPAGQLTVVTGVSGSGKSSLVFDTVYAEGQRRYVETFSPYARQFLDRMDKPQVDRIEGIPPAIAIDQTNPVRTSRSTVGTMTELNDHLKLLFARMTHLHCRRCGQAVQRDTPPSILASLKARVADVDDPRLAITFPVNVPENFTESEIESFLAAQGYTRVQARDGDTLHVVQDRLRVGTADDARASEALEAALTRGNGRLAVHVLDGEQPPVWHYSTDLHCADCDIHYADPTPSTFSFNSPLGACETCRGFGRVIGVDLGLVIPDESKTLAQGAIKPWQTESFKECQDDLTRYAAAAEVAMDIPWRDLPEAHRRWVIDGDPKFKSWSAHGGSRWYGVLRFFDWLESKAYKMHVRVLLSRYRAYTPCEACGGARLQPDALDFRLGQQPEADAVLAPEKRFRPTHVAYGRKTLETLPGLTIHDLMLLPIDRLGTFFERLDLPKPLDEASELVLGEINSRLRYLQAVGLGYLTLDRQSRTLSGGEVQRINLTTALGTSLVNTLFVLDEPSIGLHPRDMDRVVGVMQRLRAQGNTLLVVEHDPQIMVAADRLVDMGPGPGERGGQIIYEGAPQNIGEARHSLTADYLLGRRHVATARQPQPPDADTAHLSLRGVRANNLKDISLELPLNRLLCITGVSGSGKSTLVQDVLYPGLCKALGKPTETPGEHDALGGSEAIRDVVMVDQSAIGRSSRSNPASYVGAFDAVRTLFGRLEAAKERGFTAGTFSFNAGKGRCPSCGGSGFEHVEMQFLSDVYLRCPDCDGRRYRDAVLEVRLNERSIADVLEMTVAEAVTFFTPLTGGKAVVDALQPLIDVGLDYLALGQPVPTLSGGEAQRLKLAGHLVEAAARRRKRVARNDGGSTLFLFDEPTTGLHFQDINRLLGAFAKLLEGGDSLLVIEHNLDVIAASDWVIDLGPEGGDGGGRIVATGTPETIMACAQSHTGRALCAYRDSLASLELPKAAEPAVAFDARPTAIEIRHAREHNLKNINVAIPHGGFTVVTGPSGSGKSTLAFDIVFNEGQRRYLESLNAYARQFVQPAARPDVDAIWGIPPTVAIEQRISRGGRKSTVATLTEIYPFLRLLWMKLGVQYCPGCQVPIQPQTADSIAERIARDFKNQAVTVLAPMVVNRKGLYTELAKWARGKGYEQLRVDGEFRPVKPFKRLDRFKEHNIELPVARFTVTSRNGTELGDALTTALTLGKGVVQVLAEGAGQATVFSTKRACPSCGASFPEPDPRLFSFNSKHGWCESCQGTGVAVSGYQQDERVSEEVADKAMDAWLDARGDDTPCPACHGARLNPVARNVLFRDLSLPALTAQPVHAVRRFVAGLTLHAREVDIARDIVSEIDGRLSFLDQVGLAYLSLDRGAPTLSGGEAQRIRLAAQLGSNLQGVVYVLDEPTIGLHPRDNRILLDALELLEAKGNTLLVVEHDEDTIRRAHHVIDLGPGAGRLGGQIVAQGTAAELAANPTQSLTGRFLAEPLRHPVQPRRAINKKTPSVDVVAAHRHNLKDVHARFPLGRLTVVTGVSGSGKSTLARDVLLTNLYTQVNLKRGSERPPLTGCLALRGWEQVGRVLEVDQTPIGKTPRSCPATYVGFWDAIRKRFAETQDARIRGWEPGRFSFNTKGGRCEVCEGQGMVRVEMNFLPDVKLPCEACGGRRFNRETAGLSWRGQSVADVLAMSVDEAVEFFTAHPSIHHALKLLQDVGLGYLTLGQPSPTLSGGEAQRIKLVTELSKVRTDANAPPRRGANKGQTLYVLDEPTVGLHMADVEKLIRVLHRLVDAGNTVVLIEHNLDLIAEADWIVDLGPEGGDGGGEIVVQGPPEAVIALAEHSHTGAVLAEFMHGREALTV